MRLTASKSLISPTQLHTYNPEISNQKQFNSNIKLHWPSQALTHESRTVSAWLKNSSKSLISHPTLLPLCISSLLLPSVTPTFIQQSFQL